MLFNSLRFLLFFPLVYAAYLAVPHRWQNRLLLVASYVFYGSWDWRFLFLILLSTAIDYGCGLRIAGTTDPGRRKALLGVSLGTNLGLLGTFKYFDFFAASFARLLGGLGVHVDGVTLDLVLPVGISFYTFQTLSYTIDVYRGRLEPERDPVDFALFVAFFPQLVAGPIERASRLLPQIRNPRRITRAHVGSGLWMASWGFFLKIFMADNLAPIADAVFARPGPVEGITGLLAVYAFAFQILGDFAGYSFIAMGIAKLLGIDLATNFLFPYFVTHPRDFWRNWHITLSTWLRDYLYIPLGGNRGSTARVARNLAATMLLGGLWHGAAWTFVLWGAYQGGLLIAHRGIESIARSRRGDRAPRGGTAGSVVRVVAMFHLTCLGWLIFRATSVTQVRDLLVGMVTHVEIPTRAVVLMFEQIVFFAGPTMLVQWIQRRSGEVRTIEGIPGFARVPLAVAMVYALLVWGNYGGSEFIYFQF